MYLIFAFSLSLGTLFLQSVLFPSFSLIPFSPFITLAILHGPKLKALFLSLLAGMIMDLISSDPMGIHALVYTALTFFISKYRHYFLWEEPHHLGLFTSILSLFMTLGQGFMLFLFETKLPFTGKSLISDLLIMPLADGVFAMLLFGYPIKGRALWHHIKRKVFQNSL